MTPESLLKTLKTMPPDAQLVFETDAGLIGNGYHVTELKSAHVTSIDCGARVSEWTEASLQLLDGDGDGDNLMTVGKFSKIAAQSIHRIEALGSSPLHVEFAHRNEGLRIYQIAEPTLKGGKVSVRLSEDAAHCKPALDAAARQAGATCCQSGSAGSACCAWPPD